MAMRIFLFFLVVISGSGLAWGQSAPTPPAKDLAPVFKLYRRKPSPGPIPEAIKAQTQLFLQGLTRGKDNVRVAFTQVLTGSRLGERTENIDSFTKKTGEAIDMFGRIVDFEHYDTQQVGRRMTVVTYITWHELYPLQWRFVYYKPADEWKLIDLTFNSNVEDLIE